VISIPGSCKNWVGWGWIKIEQRQLTSNLQSQDGYSNPFTKEERIKFSSLHRVCQDHLSGQSRYTVLPREQPALDLRQRSRDLAAQIGAEADLLLSVAACLSVLLRLTHTSRILAFLVRTATTTNYFCWCRWSDRTNAVTTSCDTQQAKRSWLNAIDRLVQSVCSMSACSCRSPVWLGAALTRWTQAAATAAA